MMNSDKKEPMRLTLIMAYFYCATTNFNINGVDANSDDFGTQSDTVGVENEDYGYCGNMVFEPIPATPAILAKYDITLAEYSIVAGQLQAGLSFGRCALCL